MFSRDKLSNNDIDQMFQKYMNGYKVKDLLSEYDIPHTTFQRMRKEYNIPSSKKYELHYNDEMQKRFDEVFADSINGNYAVNTNDYKRNMKCNINQDYFNAIDTSNKAYILGLLYSDGHLSKKQNVCTLSLQERDKSILYKINKEIENETKISLIPYHDKNENFQNQYSIHMYGKQIYESLILHGCYPAKSLILKFPTNLPMNLYKDFMRGMIDGDGHIVCKGSEIRVRLTSTPMFCDVAKLLIETLLKINCYIIKNNRSETNVDLCISGRKQVKKFLNWIYDNDNAELYIERKHDDYLSIVNKNANNSLSN